MAQAMTELDAAIEAANECEPDDGEIRFDKSDDDGRYTFRYTKLVHACSLPEEWTVEGFGTEWFAISKE